MIASASQPHLVFARNASCFRSRSIVVTTPHRREAHRPKSQTPQFLNVFDVLIPAQICPVSPAQPAQSVQPSQPSQPSPPTQSPESSLESPDGCADSFHESLGEFRELPGDSREVPGCPREFLAEPRELPQSSKRAGESRELPRARGNPRRAPLPPCTPLAEHFPIRGVGKRLPPVSDHCSSLVLQDKTQ